MHSPEVAIEDKVGCVNNSRLVIYPSGFESAEVIELKPGAAKLNSKAEY
jgi:hypothetical protein